MDKWTGSFRSDGFLSAIMIHGDIAVSLPTDISHTNTGAELTYMGFYRHGHRSAFRFEYDDSIQGRGVQQGVSGGFKGHSISSQQLIVFTITKHTRDVIEGAYLSASPGDQGTFELSKQIPKPVPKPNYFKYPYTRALSGPKPNSPA